MNKKSTARRSQNSKVARKIDWRRFDALTDADIAAAVASDPDAAPLLTSASWLKKAKLVAPPDKELISIRVDKDVLEHFRTRPRYQTRINQILRLVMEEEKAGHR
jgi:uncharacterized protein (DUF4415 family)